MNLSVDKLESEIPERRVLLAQDRISFQEKSVVEFGCFDGSHTIALCRISNKVTAIGHLDENLELTRLRCELYGAEPIFKKMDFEKEIPERADIYFHSGILSNLTDPAGHLVKIAPLCTELFLDTHYAKAANVSYRSLVAKEDYLCQVIPDPHGHSRSPAKGFSRWLPKKAILFILERFFKNVEVVLDERDANGMRMSVVASGKVEKEEINGAVIDRRVVKPVQNDARRGETETRRPTDAEGPSRGMTAATVKHGKAFEDKAPGVLWNGHLYSYAGFGKCNREILFRVANSLSVKIDETNKESMLIDEYTRARLDVYRGTLIDSSAPFLRFLGPDHLTDRSRYCINWTMMETFPKIHPDMVGRINEGYDELWIPTESARRTFVKSGVKIPSRVMPLGVDTEVYRPIPKQKLPPCRLLSTSRAGAVEVPKGFVFLTLGLPSARKGFDVIADSLEIAFTGTHSRDANLVIALTHSQPDWNAKVYQQFSKYKVPIWALEGSLSEHTLARIYNASNAYVSASIGEGFNLPVIESAACGIPVICPDNTSHPEVAGKGAFFFPDEGPGSCPEVEVVSKWYEGMKFSVFGKKSRKHLAEVLRTVYKGGSSVRSRAILLQDRVRSLWTWDRAAKLVTQRLLEVQL